MRAIVYDRYGPPDVLTIEEVEKPAPKETELLVRVHAATVNRLDCHTREANRSNGMLVSFLSRLVSGVRGPRRPVLGTEFAGEVETIGVAVTEFAVGDRVFGNTGLRFGTHAEFAAVPQTALVEHMPVSASYAEAAAVSDGALNALWCLHGRVRPGQKVLVYGASGSIGTAGVQLARHFGADVTAVCSTNNVELVRSLGADRVIDYTQEDFTTNGETYDFIFDAVGKQSFRRCKGSLRPGGAYLATDGFRNLLLGVSTRFVGNKRVVFQIPPRYLREDLRLLKNLMDAGQYRAVIDRVYPMEQVVEAARYVETQQKVGNVVLSISPPTS